jgi:anti-anti-sigma regulatory factor
VSERRRALEPTTTTDQGLGGVMLTLAIEYIGNLMVIECKGRIVQSEAALNLRDAVMSQQNVHTILLDLARVSAIEGGGLGMLWFLQLWAENHGTELKLFNATDSVNDKLHLNDTATFRFNIATFEEAVALVKRAESRHVKAA